MITPENLAEITLPIIAIVIIWIIYKIAKKNKGLREKQ